ncbi:MAG: hypothetical protein H6Q21_483 [Bacteroidetes bacterium]|jgi:hypothetical protein|nr:hypothetical protein [Bacteroidota bacterium]
MNFEHDIFISYGAAGKQDNQDGAAWAQLFCNHLDVVLQRLFDEKPSVLLQNELLTRQQQMNENPVDVFKKTGVFVVIISPEDIGSDDYMKELGRIYEAVYPSPGDNQTRNRIFKVLTLPLQDEKELELMKAELRYNFYEINRYNKKPLTYPLQGNQLPDDKFWSKLVDLAYDIYNSLQEIKEPGKVVHSESNHRTIFLAETSFDQQENRDILKRELRHLGYKVLPVLSIPGESEHARTVIEENVRQSVVAIHMMGAYYGEFIKNAKYSLIDFQARVVKEFIESKEKCLKPYQIIWIPSDLKTTDQRQSLYLKRIKRDETQEKTEIIEAPLEVFKTIVNNKLNELAVAPVMTSETGYSLYLICEETEKPDLQDYINLIQSRGFRILTSVPAEKEYYSITEHIRLLKKADAVLIYKGDSSMEWLNSKLRDLVKVPGFGKEKPFKAIGIFSPQKTTDKSLLFLRNVTVIWNEEINNTAIHHFLDQIIKK